MIAVRSRGRRPGCAPAVGKNEQGPTASLVFLRFFRMGSPNEQLGEIEVKTGGGAVQSKTTPAFKVAVTRVTAP